MDFARYEPAPLDWNVVVADIVDSTGAIEQGAYKQVNVLGAAIITAVSKLYQPHSVPYIFGGDGVFLCVPPQRLDEVRKILAHMRLMADRQFDLQQVSGIVPVKEIRSEGYEVRIARYKVSEQYQQAVFEGEGLQCAELMVRKSGDRDKFKVEPALHPETDLSNLECRWNHLESIYDEIICLLVHVVAEKNRRQIYRQVVHAVNRIYCQDFVCKPVQEDRISLTFDTSKLSVEYKIRTFGQSIWTKIVHILKMTRSQLAGTFLMYFGITAAGTDWGRYKKDLENNTDYRKFDDMIREVLSGTREQREELTGLLESLYREGKIAYGLHVAPEVMFTCMVMDYNREHFHFVDGSAGGYAAAAASLKRRMKILKENERG